MPRPGDYVRITDNQYLQTFTPAWTSVTLGSGAINEGWYQYLGGDLVAWGFRLELGTGGAITSTVRIDMPVPAWTGGGTGLQAAVGSFVFRDTSVPAHYAGTMGLYASDGLTASFAGMWDGTQDRARLASGQPVTAAAGDVLSGSGLYRAA